LKEKRVILILFSIAILFSVLSCGKKGNPIPRGLPIPEEIKDLTGEVKDGVLFLSFSIPKKNKDGSEIKNLEGFRMYKGCGGCFGVFELLKDIKIDSQYGYTIYGGRMFIFDDDLKKGQIYSYKVVPYTKNITRGGDSNIYTIKWDDVPEPPSGFMKREEDEAIELEWKKEDGVLYNIYRRIDNTYPLFPINNKPLAVSKYRDSGLINNKRYMYEIRAVREKDGMLWEGEGSKIEATPRDNVPPGVPMDVKAELRDTSIVLTWRWGTEKDLKGYYIYRINGAVTERLTKEPIRTNTFIDYKLPKGRYLSYYITSIDMNGNESGPSQEQIIMLKD